MYEVDETATKDQPLIMVEVEGEEEEGGCEEGGEGESGWGEEGGRGRIGMREEREKGMVNKCKYI